MSQDSIETNAKRITRLEVVADNVEKSLAEIKVDVKDMNIKLDNLSIEWQKFGGLYNSVEGQNRRLSEVERWQMENAPMIEDIKEERKDQRKQVYSIVWRVVEILILGAVLTTLGIQQFGN